VGWFGEMGWVESAVETGRLGENGPINMREIKIGKIIRDLRKM
jgi:hypothetical protein